MGKDELIRSVLLILILAVLAAVIAQSRGNCEVPGSAWVPCISVEAFGHRWSL
jgi:hypothetical protein